MRERIEQLIDYMEKDRAVALDNSLMQTDGYWFGYWSAVSNVLGLHIDKLREVMNDHANV